MVKNKTAWELLGVLGFGLDNIYMKHQDNQKRYTDKLASFNNMVDALYKTLEDEDPVKEVVELLIDRIKLASAKVPTYRQGLGFHTGNIIYMTRIILVQYLFCLEYDDALIYVDDDYFTKLVNTKLLQRANKEVN